MANPEDNNSYREVRQESSIDDDGNTHTEVTKTSETVDNSAANYQSGYVSGRVSERNNQEVLAQRDEENTNRGLIIGVVLAGLAALIGSAFWYFNQSNQTVDTAPTTTSTPISSPSPVVTQTVQPQTTIIERTKEVPVERTKEVPVYVPVPQQAAPVPAPAPAKAPNVNITVPPQQPAAKTPTTQPSPASNSSSSSSSNSTSSTSPTTSQSGESTSPSQGDVIPDSSTNTETSN